MNIKGNLTISRVSGPGDDYIEICLRDTDACIEFATAKLDLATFAAAITGCAYQCVDLEVRGLEHVGSQHEHKTERVPFALYGARDEAALAAALAPFEVDGWRGRASDLVNGHKANSDGSQNVHFSRNVPKSAALEEPRV